MKIMQLYIENKYYKYLKGDKLISSIKNRIISDFFVKEVERLLEGVDDYASKVSYKEMDTFWYTNNMQMISDTGQQILEMNMEMVDDILSVSFWYEKDSYIKTRIEQGDEIERCYFNDKLLYEANYTVTEDSKFVSISQGDDISHDINLSLESGMILSYVHNGVSETYTPKRTGYISVTHSEDDSEYVVDEVTSMIANIFENKLPLLQSNTGHFIVPTHFDDTGFPYRGKIANGFSIYNIDKSEDVYSTINHPEGTHLIKSIVIEDRIYDIEEILIKDKASNTSYNKLMNLLSVYKNNKIEVLYNEDTGYKYDIIFKENSVTIKFNDITILERSIVNDYIELQYDSNIEDHKDTINEDILF